MNKNNKELLIGAGTLAAIAAVAGIVYSNKTATPAASTTVGNNVVVSTTNAAIPALHVGDTWQISLSDNPSGTTGTWAFTIGPSTGGVTSIGETNTNGTTTASFKATTAGALSVIATLKDVSGNIITVIPFAAMIS